MFLESEYRFERLERNKGNIKTEEEKIKYMEEEIVNQYMIMTKAIYHSNVIYGFSLIG